MDKPLTRFRIPIPLKANHTIKPTTAGAGAAPPRQANRTKSHLMMNAPHRQRKKPRIIRALSGSMNFYLIQKAKMKKANLLNCKIGAKKKLI
ncbi:MAG: hypothetical protein WC650_04235 [Candidatus Doudnabacteria bacterium]